MPAKRVSLYEMADAYNFAFVGLRDAVSEVAAEQDEIERVLVAQLDAIEDEMDTKVVNIGRFVMNLEWESAGLRHRADEIRDKAVRLERSAERLRKLLLLACEATGRTKWGSHEVGVVVERRVNSTLRCDVPVVDDLPLEFTRTVTEVLPDKNKIVQHYKATGETPEGAKVTKDFHLRIKEA